MDYSRFDAIGFDDEDCEDDGQVSGSSSLEALRWMERANKLVNEENMIGQAVDMYERAASMDPSLTTRASLNAATACYQAGKWRLCMRKCREILPHAKAVEIFNAALEKETRRAFEEKDADSMAECVESLPCSINRALAGDRLANYLGRSDPKKAYAVARQASEDFERQTSLSVSHQRAAAQCALSAAYLARKLKVVDESRYYFRIAMSRFAAFNDLESAAKAAFEAKEWISCAEYSTRCSAPSPLLGIALMELGRFGEAIGPLTKLPQSLGNSERLVRAYVGAERYADADSVLAVAVQESGGDERARLVELRATVAEHRRDLESAVAFWKEAAHLQKESGDPETAAKAQQRALEIQGILLEKAKENR